MKYEIQPTTSIQQAAIEMLLLVAEHGEEVTAEFNSHTLTARPGDNVNAIMKQWKDATAAARLRVLEAKERHERDATILPKIIKYLQAFPAHVIAFGIGSNNMHWIGIMIDNDGPSMQHCDLTNDPGADALSALANWTQANKEAQ